MYLLKMGELPDKISIYLPDKTICGNCRSELIVEKTDLYKVFQFGKYDEEYFQWSFGSKYVSVICRCMYCDGDIVINTFDREDKSIRNIPTYGRFIRRNFFNKLRANFIRRVVKNV